MTKPIKHKQQVFTYFQMLHPAITNGTVLDYGSGYGKFLYTSDGDFSQENYTAVDVNKNVLEEGKKFFPHANFVHYDGFNITHNRTGVHNFRPMLKDRYYDTIVSYATLPVVTTIEDSVETINWLFNLLRPGGKMLLSWLDVDNQMITDHYQIKRTKDYGSCGTIETNNEYIYLCNNKTSKIADPESRVLLFLKEKYLSSLIGYKHSFAPPRPDLGCIHSCIIIEK
jgi:SAM-dependent methyltransferase